MRPSRAFVVVVVACFGCADPGAGEGEGEVDGCELGSLRATSTTLDVTTCLTVASGPNDDSQGFRFAAGEAFDLNIGALAEFTETLPATLDETNSSAFGRFVDDGLRWDIAAGAIGGLPLGEATVTLTRIDGADIDGSVDAVAVPDGENDSLDSVFLALSF